MKCLVVFSALVACISVSSVSAGCPRGWAVLDSNCYKVFKSKLSWQEAENFCHTKGGHLASIHSREENDFVAKLASPIVKREEPWIGGQRTAEGSWVWSDGSTFRFTSWGNRQPDNNGGRENCLTTNWWNAGVWNDLSCFLQDRVKKFVCKIAPAGCENGWTQFGQKCFKFFAKKTSWVSAETDCLKNGGYLASIASQAENDFIAGTLLRHIPDNTASYPQVYIGGVQFKEGGYTSRHWGWTDRSRFGYTNWGPQEDIGRENCMTMMMRNNIYDTRGTWNDVACATRNWFPYICYKRI